MLQTQLLDHPEGIDVGGDIRAHAGQDQARAAATKSAPGQGMADRVTRDGACGPALPFTAGKPACAPMAPLGYSTNLHAAETLAELHARVVPFATAARQTLDWARLGLDLRLGDAALADLAAPGALADLRATFDDHGLSAHTLNGFPLRAFQAPRVKEQAYLPDWTDPERLASSLRLLDVALALSADPVVTISTVPGSYRPFGAQRNDAAVIAGNLGRWAAAAHRAREATGRTAILCLEPEPWCLLETSHDVAWFWRGPLATYGLAAAQAEIGAAGAEALARHLGVCVDTCHLSLAFEDQATAVTRMAAAGAVIGKCQFSAAPEVRSPATDPAGVAALRALTEPRFMHQTAATSAAGSVVRSEDLPGLDQLLARLPHATAVRSHFHIPVFREPTASGLSSTVHDSLAGLQACLAHGCPHIAVETYTWSILAAAEQDALAGTIRELAFLAQQVPPS